MFAVSGGDNETTLKNRNNRGVTYYRPPPGGLIQAIKVIFTIYMKVLSCEYHPPWSYIYLNNSKGGWAPYLSV